MAISRSLTLSMRRFREGKAWFSSSVVSVSMILVPEIRAASKALSSYGRARSTCEPCVSLHVRTFFMKPAATSSSPQQVIEHTNGDLLIFVLPVREKCSVQQLHCRCTFIAVDKQSRAHASRVIKKPRLAAPAPTGCLRQRGLAQIKIAATSAHWSLYWKCM